MARPPDPSPGAGPGRTAGRNGAAPIRLEGVRFRYPDGTVALRGLSISLRPGERMALLGRNGSGKTTLVLHLLGILRPEAGRVTVLGRELAEPDAPAAVRGRLGVLFQDPRDQLFLTKVWDDVAFGPANQGIRGEALAERVRSALAAVGLEGVAERPATHLSTGEQRRAALAAVLAMHPEALVLDEPTANLDPGGRRALARLLAGLALPQLVITHDLPFALELCPRAAVVDDGVVVAEGATGELLADRERMRRHGLELPVGFYPERR